MKLKNMYIGFVIKDFLLFVVLSWTSQRIFFNVINDDSTADAIAGVIVGIVIFCMTIYYFSRFLFFVIDLCEGIQQKRLRYKDTVNMANFKAILLSDRSEFVMKEHKNDKCLCGTVRLQEGRKGAEKKYRIMISGAELSQYMDQTNCNRLLFSNALKLLRKSCLIKKKYA